MGKRKLLGVFGNPDRADAVTAARAVLRFADRRGLPARVEAPLAVALQETKRAQPSKALARACDWAVVLGGDGTLLRVAQLGVACPVLAVNAGQLGFVTEVKAADVLSALAAMLRGRARQSARMMLAVEVFRKDARAASYFALNDAVLHSVALARLIRLRVSVDGEPVTEFRADGVIVSSPTGSTAYSMACDGPIVVPSMDAILVTPICAHPLTLRPVLVSPRSAVEVEVTDPRQRTMLTVDGQIGFDLDPGDRVRVRRHTRRFRLVHLPGSSFFQVLREKLRW